MAEIELQVAIATGQYNVTTIPLLATCTTALSRITPSPAVPRFPLIYILFNGKMGFNMAKLTKRKPNKKHEL